MTLRFKQMIYGTMILVSIMGILSGYWGKGIFLLLVVASGSYIVDTRQARRYTIMILNKLYVCLDIKVYDEMVETLRQSLIFPHLRFQTVLFFKLMKKVYEKEPEKELWQHLNKWYVLDIWRAYSEVVMGVSINQKFIDRVVTKYEQDYLALMATVKQILEAPEVTQKESLLLLRGKAENNLQFAWINLLISKRELDTHKKAYYQRIAKNIAPDLLETMYD